MEVDEDVPFISDADMAVEELLLFLPVGVDTRSLSLSLFTLVSNTAFFLLPLVLPLLYALLLLLLLLEEKVGAGGGRGKDAAANVSCRFALSCCAPRRR